MDTNFIAVGSSKNSIKLVKDPDYLLGGPGDLYIANGVSKTRQTETYDYYSSLHLNAVCRD